ncbi:MAG: PTS transporter subunit EIIC [Mycoplasmataceae bacterium]|nr:PTS transporter subunit EIIC [Mycoplasmataceae bacterium]
MFRAHKKIQSFGEVPVTQTKKEKKGTVSEFFALLSRGLMLPISMLPIAGFMLGIGSAISTELGAQSVAWDVVGQFLFRPGRVVFACLPGLFAMSIAMVFTKESGPAAVCGFLGWILFNGFQMALIVSNSDDSHDFLFYHFNGDADGDNLFNAVFTSNLGIQSLSTSVFGGIAIGTIVAFLFNKFSNIQLPKLIGFFSGVRFVPVISFGVIAVVSLLFAVAWPEIGIGLFNFGKLMTKAPGGLNSFAIAFMNRALLPFGLHFLITTTVNYTIVGGSFDLMGNAIAQYDGVYYRIGSATSQNWATLFNVSTSEGTTLFGENNIQWFLITVVGKPYDLYTMDGTLAHSSVPLTFDMIYKGVGAPTSIGGKGAITFMPGQYTSGASSVIMFCLPAACFAMLSCVPKGDNRKLAGSMLISSAFVSFLTGITEPIEFTFLFLAPWLFWGFHAVMYGVAAMINTMFCLWTPIGPHVVGADLLDNVFYSLMPDIRGGGGNLWVTLVIGITMAPLYFFMFRWAVLKFNLATPGRGVNSHLISKKEYQAAKQQGKSIAQATSDNTKGDASGKRMSITKAIEVIKAYGGLENITDIGACFTKLRVSIKDKEKVNKERLIELGAQGVIYPSPKSAYAIFGTEADVLKGMMRKVKDDPSLMGSIETKTNDGGK